MDSVAEVVEFIQNVNIAKQNMVQAFIHQYGDEINEEQLRRLDEEAAKKAFEDEIKAAVVEKDCECGCDGNCDPCNCKEVE